MGGDTLIIEAITNAGKEGMQITGQLGDVMKESASIALSWVKQYAINNNIADIQWFEKTSFISMCGFNSKDTSAALPWQRRFFPYYEKAH